MARTEITNTKLTFNNAKVMEAAAACGVDDDSKYTAAVNYTGKEDGRILLKLDNVANASKTATIRHGNMLQGVADLEVSLASASGKVVVIESGKFVNKDGKVVIEGTDANVKVSAVELP